jgi:hypothetical protein
MLNQVKSLFDKSTSDLKQSASESKLNKFCNLPGVEEMSDAADLMAIRGGIARQPEFQQISLLSHF